MTKTNCKRRELKSYKGYTITKITYTTTNVVEYVIEKEEIQVVECADVKSVKKFIDELEKNVQEEKATEEKATEEKATEEKAPEENVSRETLHETLQAQRFEAEREEYRGYEITMDETTYTYKARIPGSDRELVDETKTEIKKRIDDTLARDEELEAMKFGRITEEQVSKDRKRIAEGYGAKEYKGYILQCYDDETTFRNIGYVGEPLRGKYHEVKQRIDAYTRLSEEQNEASENVPRETWKNREYGLEYESIGITESDMTEEGYRDRLVRDCTMIGIYKIVSYVKRETYAVMKDNEEFTTTVDLDEAKFMIRYLYDCDLIECKKAIHYRGHIITKVDGYGIKMYSGRRKGDTYSLHGYSIDSVMDKIDASIDKIYEENGDCVERTYLPEYSDHGWKVYRHYHVDAGQYVYKLEFGEYFEIYNTLDAALQIVNNSFRGWLIEEYDEDEFTGYAAKRIGGTYYKIWGKTKLEVKSNIATWMERGE